MRITLSAVGLALVMASVQAVAVAPEDSVVNNTRDLVKVCSVNEDHALYYNARAFCLGYLDATWDYHQALTVGEKFDRIRSLPRATNKRKTITILAGRSTRGNGLREYRRRLAFST